MVTLPTKLSYWLWFSMLMSLAPLVLNIWKTYAIGSSLSFSDVFSIVTSEGELVLLCIPIIAASIAELLMRGRTTEIFPIWILGPGFFLFFVATGVFVYMSDTGIFESTKNEDLLLLTSIGVLFSTFLLGISSIIVTIPSDGEI